MSATSFTEPAAVVRTLMGERQVDLALTCLTSMRTMTRHPLRIVAHDDGTLTPESRDRLAGVVDQFIGQPEANDRVTAFLANYPRSQKFRRENLFGAKLFDVALLAEGRAVYIDTDILFTKPVRCPAYFYGEGAKFVVMQDIKDSYAVRIAQWPILWRLGIKLTSRLCAGMMSFDPKSHDLDYIEWMLEQADRHRLFAGFPFWAEQSIYAALAQRVGCDWIEPSQCLVAHQRRRQEMKQASILHFAGFSRPMLPSYNEGIDQAVTLAPRELGVRAASRLSLVRRLRTAVYTRAFLNGQPAH